MSAPRLRKGDTPDRGGRWTTTGKQRRSIRRDARSAQQWAGRSARWEHWDMDVSPETGLQEE